jgi:DNA-binding XRE family transcriptional regulator
MSKSPVDAIADEAADLVSNDQKESEMTDDTQIPDGASPEEIAKAQRDQEMILQYRRNLADNLRRFRARERWTQADLGRAIGSSQGQIAFLEREKQNIGLGILTKIALAFNIEPMVLISPPGDIDRYFGITSGAKPQQGITQPAPEENFSGPQTLPGLPPSRPAESPASMDTLLGSPIDPLNLAVVARIVGAAHKRIEALRHKHGSVPMTRAMLNGVLAAILNASHDTEDECETESLSLS